MNQLALFVLFLVLYSAETLNLNLSLAPGLSVKNALLYLIFVALAIETAVTRRRRIELLSILVPFGLLVAYAVFTWVVALLVLDYPNYNPRASLFALKGGLVDDLIVLLIFFYGVTDAQRALSVLRGILWIVVIGNAITVIDALNMPDLGIIHEREDGRVGGPIGSSNQFAYFLALFLPMIFALYWMATGFRKVLAGVGVLFSILAFMMAVSRGGIVGLLAGCVAGAFFLRKSIPIGLVVKAGVGVVALSAVALAVVFMTGYGELLLNRLTHGAGSTHELSSGRTFIWEQLISRMLDNPVTFITGFGWYAYETFQRAQEFGFATHSHYLNLLFNLGIIGLSLFLLAGVNALRWARMAITVADPDVRPFLLGFTVGLLALLTALSFGNLFTPWLYIWAVVGLCLRLAVSQVDKATARAPSRTAESPSVQNAGLEAGGATHPG